MHQQHPADVQRLIDDTEQFVESVNKTLTRCGARVRFQPKPVPLSELDGEAERPEFGGDRLRD